MDIVSEVSYLICFKLRRQYLADMLPTTPDELIRAKVLFHRFAGFPLLIGAVDGTHIRVRSFGGPMAELYRNRKGYFSLNVQGIVTADVIDIFSFLSDFIQCGLYLMLILSNAKIFTDAYY